MKFKIIFLIALLKIKRFSYIKPVRCKITNLALVSYNVKGAYSPLRAFFMRNLSMHSHVMAKLEGDTFECAGILLHLLTNPLQLCHPHLVMNGKAPNLVKGAHSS